MLLRALDKDDADPPALTTPTRMPRARTRGDRARAQGDAAWRFHRAHRQPARTTSTRAWPTCSTTSSSSTSGWRPSSAASGASWAARAGSGNRASTDGFRGEWARSLSSVNDLIADLTEPTIEVDRVLGAVAKGDLSERMATEIDGRPLRGEFRRSADIVNTMVDQLNAFASEVTRVAREVGTEGKLGGQAEVPGVAGHVEGPDRQRQLHGQQPDQPGPQHRRGDDGRRQGRPQPQDHGRRARRDPRAQGHHQHDGRPAQRLRLARSPASPTRSGTEGKLGGQAEVRGVGGTWKDLTDNVNFMASNLTEPGPQHRRGDDRRREGRPQPQDHGRRPGRDPRAQGHHQHDGRPAQRAARAR